MPALLIRMSSRPSCLTVSSTILRQAASSVTSTSSTAVLTPSLASSAAAASDFCLLRPATAIAAPACARPARHAEADAAVAAGDERDAALEIEQRHAFPPQRLCGALGFATKYQPVRLSVQPANAIQRGRRLQRCNSTPPQRAAARPASARDRPARGPRAARFRAAPRSLPLILLPAGVVGWRLERREQAEVDVHRLEGARPVPRPSADRCARR